MVTEPKEAGGESALGKVGKLIMGSQPKSEELRKKIPQTILDRFEITVLSGEVPPGARVLKTYSVDAAEIKIVDDAGRGRYVIDEPAATPEDRELYKLLMAQLYYSVKPTLQTTNPLEYVEKFVEGVAQEFGISEDVKRSYPVIRYYMAREIDGYGLMHVPMSDHHVEEVECGGFAVPVTVVHRDFSEFLRLETNIVFGKPELVDEMVQKFSQRAGKSTTVAYPFTDFLLPEGHRGAVTYSSEVSLPGSTFDIRKFPEDPFTIVDLISTGTLSPLLAAYYWLLQENRGFTLVIGPTSVGKTTIMNTLLSMMRPDAKIVTVEDTPELRVAQENWIRFVTRTSYTLGGREVGLFELVKLSLRYRPDYLVLGEVRGQEVQSLVQAAALGHGALTTFHADSVQSALVRLRSPPLSVGESFLLLISSFLRMGKVFMKDGSQARRVLESAEVVPETTVTEELKTKVIFSYDPLSGVILPNDPKEVAQKSLRLDAIRVSRGWSSQELVEELRGRADLLRTLASENVKGYKAVAERIFSYYSTASSRQSERQRR